LTSFAREARLESLGQLDAALHVFRSSRERQSIHDLAPGLLLVHGGAGFGAAA